MPQINNKVYTETVTYGRKIFRGLFTLKMFFVYNEAIIRR